MFATSAACAATSSVQRVAFLLKDEDPRISPAQYLCIFRSVALQKISGWLLQMERTFILFHVHIRSSIQAKNQKCRVNTMYALSNVTFRILRIKEQYSGYVE